jgi:hypothetical protein
MMPVQSVSESRRWRRTTVVLGLTVGLAGCSSSPSAPGGGVSPESPHLGSSSGPMSGTGSSGSSSGGAGESPTPGAGSSGAAPVPNPGSDGGVVPASAPSDGGPSDNATGEAGTDGAPAQMAHADLGKGDGHDVVLLGDSWMSNTLQVEGTGGGIAPSLIAVAGLPYRNYGVQGVMMLMADTFGPAIPTQYTTAKTINPDIKTVVMTGGGNDIIQNPTLQSACQMGTAACKMVLDQIGQALNTLWTQMATDGVQDVVYINYASNVGTTAQSLRGDGGVPTPSICMTGKIRCHEVDTTAAVMSQIAADGIHPLQAANQRIAAQVYMLMTQEGMRR